MKKLFPLILFILWMGPFSYAQPEKTTANGWTYQVMKEGYGTYLSPHEAIEHHNQLVDADGRVLVSTYVIGVPDYQLVSELSSSFQQACQVMQEGGKYRFKIPMADFKKAAKGGAALELPGEHVLWEVELLKILPPKPDISKVVKELIQSQGVNAAYQKFLSLKDSDEVYFGEWEVNEVGYIFLNQGTASQAVTVFEFNVKCHPKSANAHDSLAEAYLKNGKNDLARQHYQQSLSLNPANANAKKMLAELKF